MSRTIILKQELIYLAVKIHATTCTDISFGYLAMSDDKFAEKTGSFMKGAIFMKIFVLAFLAGIGYRFGAFLCECLIGLIPRKRRRSRVSYMDR